jgi:hypothetical protein
MVIATWVVVVAALLGQVTVERKRPPRPGEVVHLFDFDKEVTGAMPGNWTSRAPASGKKPAEWTVVADPFAPSKPHVLAVTTLAEDPTEFNVVMIKDLRARVFKFTAQIKANSGKEDQGGGLIWRVVDEKNYYLARMNPTEGNFRVYKVVDGKRTQLGSLEVAIERDKWYTIQVVSLGEGFVCTLNRTWTLQFSDRSLPEPGFLGLWTKADAMSAFDDVEVIVQDSLVKAKEE